jgi:predicted alpha/beta hydrolase family esterase
MNSTNKKVFLIHGFEGTPNGGWRPYIMGELEKKDIYAFSLSMPSPESPKLNEWLDEIEQHINKNSNDDIYLVGHSLGGTALLRYFEKDSSLNVKGVVFVSTPCHQNANEKIKEFLSDSFNWEKIKNNTHGKKIRVIHGDNDPYVPVSDAQNIINELGGELIIIPNGKHLNGSSGYTELPELISILNLMI